MPDCLSGQDLYSPRAHRLTEDADRSRVRDNICLHRGAPGKNNPSLRTNLSICLSVPGAKVGFIGNTEYCPLKYLQPFISNHNTTPPLHVSAGFYDLFTRYFTFMISFDPPNSDERWVGLGQLFPFYTWGDWGPERERCWSQVIHLAMADQGFQTRSADWGPGFTNICPWENVI